MNLETEAAPVWQCDLRPGGTVPNPNLWTVGDRYILSCQGLAEFKLEEPLAFIFENSKLKYALVPLGLKKVEPRQFELEVTSYNPGEYEVAHWQIADNKGNQIEIGEVKWRVESVLNSEQPVEPAPGYGFLKLNYSYFLTIPVFLFLLGLIVWGLSVFYRRHRIRQLVNQKVGSLETGNPLQEWNLHARSLKRRFSLPQTFKQKISGKEFVSQIKEQLELFLVRTMRLPFHCRSLQELRPWIQRRFPQFEINEIAKLEILFLEIQRALMVDEPSAEDCEQLYQNSVKLVHRVQEIVEQGGAG